MCAGGVEGALVLTQAALEMVSWHLLVEERKSCSVGGFRGLPAEDKIRFLLTHCGIPLLIPVGMSDLIAEGRKFNWDDGPAAITQIRNALAHGQPKQLETELQRDHSIRYDAWCLGLWYLELSLLKLFGFEGKYFSRVKRESYSFQNIDTVPWSSSTIAGAAGQVS